MSTLPDRFDIWVRKARVQDQTDRQVDLLLGAMFALEEWYLPNQGTAEKPYPALIPFEDKVHLLVFTSASKLDDALAQEDGEKHFPNLALKTRDAVEYCCRFTLEKCTGILVNPGDFAFAVDLTTLKIFGDEWKNRSLSLPQGYWIPSMTSEEEDFWQENGL